MTLNIEKNIREDQSEAAKKASIKIEKKRKPRKKKTVKPRTREGSNNPNRPKMTQMKIGTLKNASKYDE